jgi:hypothetical protein
MSTTKRNLFNELMQGLGELAHERQGEITLRTHVAEWRRRDQEIDAGVVETIPADEIFREREASLKK